MARDHLATTLEQLAACLVQVAQALRHETVWTVVEASQQQSPGKDWKTFNMMKDALAHELSVRALYALWSVDVRSLDQLMTIAPQQIKNLRNCGKKSQQEILAFIEAKKAQVAEEQYLVI